MILLSALLALSMAQAPSAAEKAQAVVRQLSAGDFGAVEAQFDDKMKAALPEGRLAATWNGVVAQVGALKEENGAREQAIGAVRVGIVTCAFERATLNVQIAFDPEGRISGLAIRPAAPAPYVLPPYADPAAFTETEATIGSGEWALPGTLTLPNGAGPPFPAVVLVHGSGPNDRDETIGADRPFKDLAVGLASRGVAVLRYDKRTKVHGAAMAGRDITVKDEVIDDVAAAVALLRTNPRVDPKRIVVLGHSLGGMLVPRIAATVPDAAGFIVMAGAARPLEQAMLEQIKYLATADGTISPEEQKAIDQAQQTLDAVRALTPADATAHKVVEHAPASYWLDLRGYDPPSAAKAIKQPMLILQGERDYQVTMDEFAKWKAALAGKKNVTFKSYPALNHLFIAGTGKSLPAEYSTPGHIAQDVVDDMARWIKAQ